MMMWLLSWMVGEKASWPEMPMLLQKMTQEITDAEATPYLNICVIVISARKIVF